MPPANQPNTTVLQPKKSHTLTIALIIFLLVLLGSGGYLYTSGLWQTLTPSHTAPSQAQSSTSDIEQSLQASESASTTDIDTLESQL